MSRTLIHPVVAVPVLGLLLGWSAPAAAQDAPPNPQAPAQNQRPPRPVGGANLQVAPLPPELEQLLTQWAQESAKIQKLEGRHYRFVYDKVFSVEKRSKGAFYYEAPDKGRIDLIPVTVAPGTVSKETNPKTGKPYEVKSDRAEKWICNGRDVKQVNDAEKKVEIFPIPPQAQGANIMDGPLPFLFGMPPDKAKLRYRMKLVGQNQHFADIEVEPRWQQDAANWRKATIRLYKVNWMPSAVKLIDPTGNTVTVYSFPPEELQINKQRKFFEDLFGIGEKDPFNPKLAGYTPHVINPQAAPPSPPQSPAALPPVVNMPYPQAKRLLERAGCQVTLQPGGAPPQDALALIVAQQTPPPGTPLRNELPVTLTVNLAGSVMPDVSGYHWTDIQPLLEGAGYKVKLLRGGPAPGAEQTYTVYEQQPPPEQKLAPGSTISLRLYDAPAAAAAPVQPAAR